MFRWDSNLGTLALQDTTLPTELNEISTNIVSKCGYGPTMVPISITLGRGALCYTSLYCISINIPRYFSADIENLSSVVISVYKCKVSVQSYIDIFSFFFSKLISIVAA
jgi:hypothetical protein